MGPDTPSIDFIRSLECHRLRALVAADADLARSLHADDYQLITPGGAALSKEMYLRGLVSGDLNYLIYEPVSEIAVASLGTRPSRRRTDAGEHQ
ncbi:MAG: DUF4440 domain-containing protein [bacterium]